MDAALDDVLAVLQSGHQYQPDPNGKRLPDHKTISDVWPQLPPKERLHVYVSVGRTSEYLIRLLVPPQDI